MIGTARLSPETIKVGDGVTEHVGSDRYAGTVTYVSPSGKTIRFTHDQAKMKPGHTIHTQQEYDYTSVEERTWEDQVFGTRTNAMTARWSAKRERFVYGGRGLSSGRHQHQDPSF